jgi:hypothetical protein
MSVDLAAKGVPQKPYSVVSSQLCPEGNKTAFGKPKDR